MLRFAPQVLGVVALQRAVHRGLRGRERDRALRREQPRRLERRLEHGVVHGVDQTALQRLVRVDDTPGEDQLLREADPAHAREALRPSPAGDDAEVDLRLAELGRGDA